MRFRLFDGIDCGASNRSTMFVKALSQVGHVDVISFGGGPYRSNIDDCDIVFQEDIERHVKEKPPVIKQIGLLFGFLKRIVIPGDPYQYYPLDENKKQVIDDIIAKGDYDFIACRYINEAVECGLLDYSDRLVIEVDDNPVSFAKTEYLSGGKRFKFTSVMHYVLSYTVGIMSRKVLGKIRHSFHSNISDPPCEGSVYLPNVTMLQGPIPSLKGGMPHVMLLVGFLDYAPNRYGAQHFARNILPLVRKKIPDAELRIAGRCITEGVIDSLNSLPGVTALGYVEDIRKEYENCGVVVIPVYQGSGTSIKFVEAMKMNRPVVSTPKGVRGLEDICKAGVHYLPANDDAEFAESIIRLFNDAGLSKKLSASAMEACQSHFSEEVFIEIVKKELS